MNETDFIRAQLAAERGHLRDILEAVRAGTLEVGAARPAAAYIEWARQRLVAQLDAHRRALEAMPATGADTRAQLAKLAGAAAGLAENATVRPLNGVAERLLALLNAWSDSLDSLAGRTLRVGHWRQAAQLSADTILEERQRYAAARGARGVP
jgi:hypothetical protein